MALHQFIYHPYYHYENCFGLNFIQDMSCQSIDIQFGYSLCNINSPGLFDNTTAPGTVLHFGYKPFKSNGFVRDQIELDIRNNIDHFVIGSFAEAGA
ncbi:MAG TPA: hypothetical protein DDY13_01030 [Cytophagales bacterium]|jgi:hypothetical protein|nr:hypothetical protein [Cytophagales bacterium]